jgi:hypothetical protein
MPSDQITNRNGNASVARSELDTFLVDLKKHSGPSTRGRLIFALDATASREATWDTACKLQAEMFQAAATVWQPRSPAGLLPRPWRVPRLTLDVQ